MKWSWLHQKEVDAYLVWHMTFSLLDLEANTNFGSGPPWAWLGYYNGLGSYFARLYTLI